MSRAAQSLFPHQKLDWTISRLQERVDATPDDPTARIELAGAMVSRGLYHGGGERVCNDALAHVRRALTDDPASARPRSGALVVWHGPTPRSGAYLDQPAVEGELLLRLAMGKMERLRGEYGQAVRQPRPPAVSLRMRGRRTWSSGERSCRSQRRAQPASPCGACAVPSGADLQREPSTERVPEVIRDLGIVCMQTGRHREAERFFGRLKQHDKYRASAHALGRGVVPPQVQQRIQHLRQYLRKHPDNFDVLAMRLLVPP